MLYQALRRLLRINGPPQILPKAENFGFVIVLLFLQGIEKLSPPPNISSGDVPAGNDPLTYFEINFYLWKKFIDIIMTESLYFFIR